MRTLLLSIIISLTILTVRSQGFERIMLRDGATKAGDGFYVHIDGGRVAARPPEWPERTFWFYVRAPRHLNGTELGDCVIHIEDGHGQLLGTFRTSPHRGDQANEEGVFDVIVVPELFSSGPEKPLSQSSLGALWIPSPLRTATIGKITRQNELRMEGPCRSAM